MAELLNYHPARQLALHAECEHEEIAFKATSSLANEPTACFRVGCKEREREREKAKIFNSYRMIKIQVINRYEIFAKAET